MRGEWFQWERQGTVHSLLACMEAWMEPMKKAYGRAYPPTVIIFNNDLVGWYIRWADILDYGQYLIDQFINSTKMKELESEVIARAKTLEQLFQRLDCLCIRELNDAELEKTYAQIHRQWIEWFIPGGLVEPIGHQGEKLLEERLDEKKKLSRTTLDISKTVSLITTTTRESFSKRELRELLRILIAKKEGCNVEAALEAHAARYYWIHNNYFSTEVLDFQFFLNELKVLEEKCHDPAGQLHQMEMELEQNKKDKERIMNELHFDVKERALVALLDLFAWYQDYRKEYAMRLLHYLDMILAEIGARKHISLKEMRYSLPIEINDIIACRFDKTTLRERMKRCLFYWDENTQKFEFGTGQFSIDKEKEIFHSLKHNKEITEVTGMVANTGIVRGPARITMSAKEAADIKPGEILITSMTTPDFVTAIKRAAAIVTNEGGVLCHAAIVSREFGIPCIVGTRIATKLFKTGDLIEVNGNLGIVRKIDVEINKNQK